MKRINWRFLAVLAWLSTPSFAFAGPLVTPMSPSKILTAAKLNLYQNTETLTGSKTLVIGDYAVQRLDPGGADRDVTLPAEATATNLAFWIFNDADASGEDLTIKNDTPATVVTLGPGMGMMFTCDGTDWVAIGDDGIVYDAYANTITSYGNLGITKADPAIVFTPGTPTDTRYWMGVTEDAGGDDDDKFQLGDGAVPGTNPFVTVLTDGKVGIGTANPNGLLNISGDSPTFRITNTTAGGVESFIQNVYTGGNNFMRFYEGGYGMALYSNAGVSIGTNYVATLSPENGLIVEGSVGIGTTAPDTRLHAEIDDATTNATTNVQTLTHTTSGTPAANIGAGLAFEVETAAANNEIVATVEGIATTVTGAAEQGALVFKTMNTGAAASEALRIQNKTLVYANETVTCVTEAGTASPLTTLSLIVTDGDADTDEDTVSLADGILTGQLKIFVYKTETDAGDSANVTPAHPSGFAKILFDTPGEGCTMIWDGAGWAIVSNNGGTLS